MSFYKSFAYFVIVLLAAMPLILLITSPQNSLSFSNLSNSMRSTGKILGLIGMILFSITFFLNTRLKITEKLFSGLNNAYISHHLIGTIAFLFLIFHPLFLASQFITLSIAATLNFLYPFINLAISFGSLALFLMTLLLFLTFFTRLKYQTWKFTHRVLGVSFALASLHVLLISSDTSRIPLLKAYMIIFIILGILSYSYRTLFWKLFIKRKPYKIKSINAIGDITEITLESDKHLNFKPGQFAFVSFKSKSVSSEPHPFTISSSPQKNEISFSIKSLGDFTENLKNLKKGDSALIEGPYGGFSFEDYPSKKYIFIAGGIGITPFLSMLRSIYDSKKGYNFDSIDLYYSVKTLEEASYYGELKKILGSLPSGKLKVFLNISRNEGYLTADKISRNSKEFKDSGILICGPVSMMHSLKEQFVSLGMKRSKIKTEEFGLL